MNQYRVGLIGFGFIGKVHAYAHRTIPFYYDQTDFGSQITHICTSRMETAKKASEQIGAPNTVTDYRQITENPEIDIVDICTPNDLHAEAVLSAIRHGKHIYCDKPLTGSLDDALRIEEALKNYHGIGQMTFQNRFFPATIRAKQLIEQGLIGEVLEFQGQFLHSGSVDPNAPFKWKLAAGTIADLGSHILDLLQSMLGEFSELTASTRIAFPRRPDAGHPDSLVPVTAEDNMLLLLKLPNGACGSVRASKIATGAEDSLSFEIHGTKGAIRMDPMNLNQLFYYNASVSGAPYGGMRGWTAIDCGQRYEKPAGFPTPKAPMGWMRGHVHCLYTFLNSIYLNQQLGPSLSQGVRIQKLLEKVKESAREHTWVSL